MVSLSLIFTAAQTENICLSKFGDMKVNKSPSQQFKSCDVVTGTAGVKRGSKMSDGKKLNPKGTTLAVLTIPIAQKKRPK